MDHGTREFRQNRYAAQGAKAIQGKRFSTRTELNRCEPAIVAAKAGNQPTGTYQSPLMRYTYNMPPSPAR